MVSSDIGRVLHSSELVGGLGIFRVRFNNLEKKRKEKNVGNKF